MKRAILTIQEPVVKNVIAAALGRNGFIVQTVVGCVCPSHPDQCALECLSRQSHAAPDLMVLDVVVNMDCSGVEAALKALRRWPRVKVLLTSATPSAYWPPTARELFPIIPKASCAFLLKPFTVQQLKAVVDVLLGSGA